MDLLTHNANLSGTFKLRLFSKSISFTILSYIQSSIYKIVDLYILELNFNFFIILFLFFINRTSLIKVWMNILLLLIKNCWEKWLIDLDRSVSIKEKTLTKKLIFAQVSDVDVPKANLTKLTHRFYNKLYVIHRQNLRLFSWFNYCTLLFYLLHIINCKWIFLS